jgi:glycosyltransferase involved in cell wall biosynthesis
MRILHVTPYYQDAWAYGGIPRLAAALTKGLARRGHRVTVVTTDVRDAATRLADTGSGVVDGVEVCVFRNLSNRLAYHLQLFLPIGFESFLRREIRRFDIAHLHACHNVLSARAAAHLHHAGVPFVLAPNGTAPRIERRHTAKWLFDATVGRGLADRADAWLAVSEAERRQFLTLVPPGRPIHLVSNPIDLAEFAALPERGRFRCRFGLSDERLVLYLGKLTPRKRLDVLVRAVARLGRSDVKLVIAGNDMGVEAEIRGLVRELGIEHSTIFAGLLAGVERIEALRDADVVSYASKDEIFGLVPIEALLSGTPTIVADDSGCGEVIRQVGGGLVIPEGSVDALSTAIDGVLGEAHAWRERAEAAGARAAIMFGAEQVTTQLEQVYLEVLRGAGAAGSSRRLSSIAHSLR